MFKTNIYISQYFKIDYFIWFINSKIPTTSPHVNEIKLTEQNCGPGPELSHNATKGLLWANGSCRNFSSGRGEGMNFKTLTIPCDQDNTSYASALAPIYHT